MKTIELKDSNIVNVINNINKVDEESNDTINLITKSLEYLIEDYLEDIEVDEAILIIHDTPKYKVDIRISTSKDIEITCMLFNLFMIKNEFDAYMDLLAYLKKLKENVEKALQEKIKKEN